MSRKRWGGWRPGWVCGSESRQIKSRRTLCGRESESYSLTEAVGAGGLSGAAVAWNNKQSRARMVVSTVKAFYSRSFPTDERQKMNFSLALESLWEGFQHRSGENKNHCWMNSWEVSNTASIHICQTDSLLTLMFLPSTHTSIKVIIQTNVYSTNQNTGNTHLFILNWKVSIWRYMDIVRYLYKNV